MATRKTLKKQCLQLLGGTALCCITAIASAACEKPSFDLEIPDGKTASTQQMQEIQAAVKSFVEQGEEFVNCVKKNERRTRAERLSNDILDEMQRLAANFNRQLRYHRRAN